MTLLHSARTAALALAVAACGASTSDTPPDATAVPEDAPSAACMGMCAPRTGAAALEPEDIRFATYNILGSHFLPGPSPMCLDRTGAACTSYRAQNMMKIVRGEAGFGAFDVVGVQEMERDQFIEIGQGLSGVDPAHAGEPLLYDRHPVALDPDYLTKNIDDYQRTLYWRRDRFSLVAKGTVVYPTNDGTNIGVSRPSYAPWIELRSRQTGRMFVVLNHHAAVTTVNMYRSPQSAVFREQTAHIIVDWAAQVRATKHVPVIVMGDFNSTFELRNTPGHDDDIAYGADRTRLPYCVMTTGGVLANAADVIAGKAGACPTLVGVAVDHIYAAVGEVVTALVRVPKHAPTSPATDLVAHCSDHGPVYADLRL